MEVNAKTLAALALIAAASPVSANSRDYQERLPKVKSAEAASLYPGCTYKRSWEPTKNPSILIPLYTVGSYVTMDENGVCNHPMFVNVAKGCKAVVAVLNPVTGPMLLDSPQLPAMKACMQMLNDHGVQMIGYTHTKIAKVDPSTGIWSTSAMRDTWEVGHDMDIWLETAKGMPMFKGFFFDDTTNFYQTSINAFGIDHIAWYRNLVNLAKQKLPHSRIVLNPGSFVDLRLMRANASEGYPEAADITIPFEDFARKWRPAGDNCSQKGVQWNTERGNFGPGPWCPNVPVADKVEPFMEAVKNREFEAAAVVHSADGWFVMNEGKVAMANGFKYFFASDIPLINGPWGAVPKVWDMYLNKLNDEEEGVQVEQAPQQNSTSAAPADSAPPAAGQTGSVEDLAKSNAAARTGGIFVPFVAALSVLLAQML